MHRLVAMAFLPNPNNYAQVNHIDEDKNNNSLSNLEWCDEKYNMNYGTGPNRRRTNRDYSKPVFRENAIKNGKKTSKPVIQFSKEGEFIQRYESGRDASRRTGVNHSHILECCAGKKNYKTAGGYIWKYEKEVQ